MPIYWCGGVTCDEGPRLERGPSRGLLRRCRGGTSGRSSLVDCVVRLIFEGFTSRPGVRRGSPSRNGRGRCAAAHSRRREPRATVLGLPGARVRPGSAAGAIVVVSVKRGGLPEECGELARAGDRDHSGRLAPLLVEVLPALVQTPLRAPGDLEHARVLAMLAASERRADARRVAVVVGCFDKQSAGVTGPGFGDRALPALAVGCALGGHDAEEAGEQRRSREARKVADL